MTTLPAVESSYVDAPEVAPRKLARKATGVDRVFELSASAIGATVLLDHRRHRRLPAWQSVPTLQRYGWGFFTESAWQPEADSLGIGAVLVGTLSVAASRW